MPFVPISNCIRVVINWTGGAVNVLHVRPTSGPGPYIFADVQDAVLDVQTAFKATILPILSDQGAVDTFVGTDVTEAGGTQYEITDGTAGGVVDEDLPPQVALVTTWRTVSSSRRKRGRSYWPHIPRTKQDNDASYVTELYRAQMETESEDFRGALSVTNNPLAVASRVDGLAYLIASASVDRRFDTQRRRLPRAT